MSPYRFSSPAAMRVLLAPIWVLLGICASATAWAQSPPSSGPVTEQAVSFSSWSPASYAEIRAGRESATPTPLSADLFLPAPTPRGEPLAAIVLLHGSSGFSNGYGRRIAADFARDGIAALVVYSYRSRGIDGRPSARELARKVPRYAQIADAYAALAFLSSHERIDPGRIALGGFSIGGKTTVFAAIEEVARAFQPDGRRFAAHVSYWGTCDALYEKLPATGAPILLLIGEKDAVTPLPRCRELADNLRRAGAPVDLIVYADAYHGWNAVDFAPRYFAERHNPAPCRWILSGDGRLRETSTGVEGAWDDPALAAGFACLAQGYTIGKNEAASAKARRDVVSFLSGL